MVELPIEYLTTRDTIEYTKGSEITIISKPDGTTVIEVKPEILPQFQELVRRACNTWDNDSPAIQEFRDIILVGHIQQDYIRPNQKK